MELKDHREKIDEIDKKIVELLDARVGVCREIGKMKIQRQADIFDSAREKLVLEKVSSETQQAPVENVRSVYREIISMCRSVQRPTTIAYLGPQGSFTHEAASSAFGSSSKYVACRKVGEIFNRVDLGDIELGVVPLENSLEGAVNETLDRFAEYKLSIVGEIQLRINENLIVRPHVETLSQVERLYSHPQALAQCDNYITKYLGHADVIATDSTARAVEHVLRDEGGAAIGSKVAAELNELKVFAFSIEDHPNNYTRFVVIRKGQPQLCGEKTSVLFSVDNTPGSVAAVLSELARYNVNITMILSRPIERKPWEYMFFMDLEGSAGDERCSEALKTAESRSRVWRILGSYSRLL